MTAVWVYAVAPDIRQEWIDGVPGVNGLPVRSLPADGLAAAVTDVSLDEFGEDALAERFENIKWLAQVAREHHRIIETLARHVAVVPMRLATVYRAGSHVTEMMVARRDEFERTLELIGGRTEWGVKVFATPYEVRTPVQAADQGRPGTAYLRERQRQLTATENARRVAAATAEEIDVRLAGLAKASQRRALLDPELTGEDDQMLLNGAYLVDDERSPQFAAAVGDLADGHSSVRIELTGPWPPYSFASLGDE